MKFDIDDKSGIGVIKTKSWLKSHDGNAIRFRPESFSLYSPSLHTVSVKLDR